MRSLPPLLPGNLSLRIQLRSDITVSIRSQIEASARQLLRQATAPAYNRGASGRTAEDEVAALRQLKKGFDVDGVRQEIQLRTNLDEISADFRGFVDQQTVRRRV